MLPRSDRSAVGFLQAMRSAASAQTGDTTDQPFDAPAELKPLAYAARVLATCGDQDLARMGQVALAKIRDLASQHAAVGRSARATGEPARTPGVLTLADLERSRKAARAARGGGR